MVDTGKDPVYSISLIPVSSSENINAKISRVWLFNKQQKKREAELLSFSDTTETLMDNDNTSGICFKSVRERRQVKEK